MPINTGENGAWVSSTPKVGTSEATVKVGENGSWVDVSAASGSTLASNAVHLWYIDEGSGGTVVDSVGSADGSISLADWVTGSGGYGDAYLDFSPSTDAITEHGVVFTDQSQFTAVVWCRPVEESDAYVMQQDITDGFLIWLNSNEKLQGNVGGTVGEAYIPNYGAWHMVVVTYDGSGTAYFYVYEKGQGQVFSDSWSTSDPTWPGNDEFTLGNRPDLNRDWSGDIDYALLTDIEESEADITGHYNSTVDLY